jgi:hypothetical protein
MYCNDQLVTFIKISVSRNRITIFLQNWIVLGMNRNIC